MPDNPFAKPDTVELSMDDSFDPDLADDYGGADETAIIARNLRMARAKKQPGVLDQEDMTVEPITRETIAVPGTLPLSRVTMQELSALIQQRLIALEHHRQSCAVVLAMARELQGAETGPLTDLVRTMLGLE